MHSLKIHWFFQNKYIRTFIRIFFLLVNIFGHSLGMLDSNKYIGLKNSNCENIENSTYDKTKKSKCDRTNNLKCDKTQKLKLWELKNWNCGKPQIVRNLKTKSVTKLKLKLWQNWKKIKLLQKFKYQIMT